MWLGLITVEDYLCFHHKGSFSVTQEIKPLFSANLFLRWYCRSHFTSCWKVRRAHCTEECWLDDWSNINFAQWPIILITLGNYRAITKALFFKNVWGGVAHPKQDICMSWMSFRNKAGGCGWNYAAGCIIFRQHKKKINKNRHSFSVRLLHVLRWCQSAQCMVVSAKEIDFQENKLVEDKCNTGVMVKGEIYYFIL